MSKQKKKERNIHQSHRQKYRIDITDDDTYSHIITFHTTKRSVGFLIAVILLSIVLSVVSIITFSPLKYYIPELRYAHRRESIENLKKKVDSLQSKIEKQDKLYGILQLVIRDDLEHIDKYDSLFFDNYPSEEELFSEKDELKQNK